MKPRLYLKAFAQVGAFVLALLAMVLGLTFLIMWRPILGVAAFIFTVMAILTRITSSLSKRNDGGSEDSMSTETKAVHTPGIWHSNWCTRTNNEPRKGWHVYAGDLDDQNSDMNTFGAIAIIRDDEQAEANARLIAAAPDMLEALKAILDSASDGREIPEWLSERLVPAIAAIRKAEGQ